MWIIASEANSRSRHRFTLVAGVSADDRDGTLGQKAIEELEVDGEVYLVWEPGNEAGPRPILLETKDGRQVGYLPVSLEFSENWRTGEGRLVFAVVAWLLEPNLSFEVFRRNLLVIEDAPDVAKEDVGAYEE